jgi:hypothetical protein
MEIDKESVMGVNLIKAPWTINIHLKMKSRRVK